MGSVGRNNAYEGLSAYVRAYLCMCLCAYRYFFVCVRVCFFVCMCHSQGAVCAQHVYAIPYFYISEF